MKWVEQYEKMSEKDKEKFQVTANRLLNKTFLVYGKDKDRQYYRFVEKNLEVFQGYFSIAKWDLLHHKRLSVFQLYNIEEKNRYRFNLQETIFLLILRLLYDEKQKDLQLTRDIVVAGFEIQEKYMALQIKDRLPSKEEMRRILRMLSGYSLLELKTGDYKDPEAKYVLYPSLKMVVDDARLDSMGELLGMDDFSIELEESDEDLEREDEEQEDIETEDIETEDITGEGEH
ncbi:DUF4194 domain-containing protein [Natranaerobius thermophilus]